MSVGERIIELRKNAGLSQGQLASMLDVSRQAVSKWENDQTTPDSMKLIHLADVLDTDIEYLTTGRRTYGRRPPIVLNSVETVEKVVEKPIIQEKIVERIVEKPLIQYIEKPVIRRGYRIKYQRNPVEFIMVALAFFIIGFLLGILF